MPCDSTAKISLITLSEKRGPLLQRRENKEDQEAELVPIENGKATANAKPTSTWARLIRRIFEVDPRNTPRPGNVRPKTRDSAPAGSGSGQNPSARLEAHPSVAGLSAHEPQGMP